MISRDHSIIPKEKIKIIYGDLKNTADQIRTFELPDDPALVCKKIAIVSHAPHLSSILHMIDRYKPFPHGSIPYLFPIPTAKNGRDEFAFMEIKGLLYYIFIAKNASEDPYPYQLHHFQKRKLGHVRYSRKFYDGIFKFLKRDP